MQTTTIEPTKKIIKVRSRCSICNGELIKINYLPKVCKNCKTNIAYIARNSHDPSRKIDNLKLRIVALTAIKHSPKIGISEALRQAINYVNSTRANQIQEVNQAK